MRHRKSWRSSSGVGRPKLATCTPAGSHWPTTWRTVPPLPEVSSPCSTSSTLRAPPLRPSAKSCSCSVARRSACFACAFLAADLPFLKPGVARGSNSLRSIGPDGARRRVLMLLAIRRAECPVMVLTREYVDIPVDGRAMRTFVAAPRGGRAAPRRRLLHRHLPAHRAVAALGGAARRLRLPRRGARDLPPDRAGRDRARVRRRGQGARPGRRRRDHGGRLRRRRRRRARLARRAGELDRRRGPLHRRPPRVPRRLPPAGARDRVLVRDRAARRQARQGPGRRLARPRRRDRGRAADGLGHEATRTRRRPGARRSRPGSTRSPRG